jgi:hypothetical protein
MMNIYGGLCQINDSFTITLINPLNIFVIDKSGNNKTDYDKNKTNYDSDLKAQLDLMKA